VKAHGDDSPGAPYWYFGPEQTISPGWSTPARHSACVATDRMPIASGTECCCDTSITTRVVCPVSAERSWL
jgi:hypothetical protein